MGFCNGGFGLDGISFFGDKDMYSSPSDPGGMGNDL
jgi:hypothetical protein